MAFDQVLAARVRALLDDAGPVRQVRMAGEALIVRLGAEGAAAVIEGGLAGIFAPAGRAVAGMVSVEAADRLDTPTLKVWIHRAVTFVTSLPVKP